MRFLAYLFVILPAVAGLPQAEGPNFRRNSNGKMCRNQGLCVKEDECCSGKCYTSPKKQKEGRPLHGTCVFWEIEKKPEKTIQDPENEGENKHDDEKGDDLDNEH